jgi:regulation of enolase protein 1 (concanavalin A-like superfamily)
VRRYLHLAVALATLALLVPAANAQTPPPSVPDSVPALDGIPGPLVWQHPPKSWKIDNGKTLTITAGKATNWYISAVGDDKSDSSNRLLFKPAADFVLSAKVTVGNRSTWDAGGLVLYVNDTLWAKFGIEVTTNKIPTIVSVVTRGISDDNNSIAIDSGSAYLKVAKAGTGILFYESPDGKNWSIIRAFTLGDVPDLRVGFSSQSPVGEGCTSVFSEIQYQPKKIDLWAGK